jgi:hypothetical protein
MKGPLMSSATRKPIKPDRHRFLVYRGKSAGTFRFKPNLETLEDRVAPAVLTVTTLLDSGPGSPTQ